MTTAADNLYQAALKLSDRERAELADKLLESIDPALDTGWAESWDAEIAKRIDDLDQGNVKTIPWAEARRIISGQSE